MQLSLKPVKRRHQLYQPSIKRNKKIKNKSLKPVNRGINCANVQILNIQRQEFQAVDYCFGKRAVTSSMVGSCTSEIIFIVFSVTNFPHKWRHSRGGIFVVDQRKSDLQNSLFMILNHVRGSDIDFGKYLKIGKKNCLCLSLSFCLWKRLS